MDFTEVTISTATPGIDPVTGLLDDLGIEGYVLEDAADFQEFLQDTEIYWDYVDEDLVREKSGAETRIKIYLTQDADGEAQLAALRQRLDTLRAADPEGRYGRLAAEAGTVRQEDWEWGWKQYFKPFPVGTRFIVKPSWEECAPEEGRMVLEIDPASSFGTGSHETTQLCMAALEKAVHGGEKVLDMGTGSGILAIAAAMLGAEVGAVVDIDENCLKTAQENAEKNGVRIGRGFCGDALRDPALADALGGGYDVIVANIVADVIIGMAPMFAGKLRAGGALICSGILDGRADEVAEALRQAGFTVAERAQRGDWVRFTAAR
ncbi:50S ribosomal protein L11 methyltransferase [Intestinibacillus massiliensis]|nr:50S ribosomal protein L11 methyltransferase [Intestinibacillus massiliensis]